MLSCNHRSYLNSTFERFGLGGLFFSVGIISIEILLINLNKRKIVTKRYKKKVIRRNSLDYRLKRIHYPKYSGDEIIFIKQIRYLNI